MDDATVFEFKLLVAGVGLMVTGATLLRVDSAPALAGFFALPVGFLAMLGGFSDQSVRYPDE